jgi:hypothetical protein
MHVHPAFITTLIAERDRSLRQRAERARRAGRRQRATERAAVPSAPAPAGALVHSLRPRSQ